jgi:hypothetical protein
MSDKPEQTSIPPGAAPAPTFYKDPGPQGPSAPKQPPPAGEDPTKPDPTRYGDWEINGRCIDF